ncbi:MAG: ATP-binding protein [Rubrivivax sp.]
MSIRRTLLLAFLLVGLTPAAVLALLAFDRASRVLQADIEQGLAAQADALAADVGRLLFERLQNAVTWARVEALQDLAVGDVDRRASATLQRLAAGYGGLYDELRAIDANGRVVASSRAAALGTQAAAPSAAPRRVSVGAAVVEIDADAGAPARLTLATAVPSAFGERALGTLQLRLDLLQFDRLLEPAALDGRRLALLDEQGRVLAASEAWRAAGAQRGQPLAAAGDEPMLMGRAVTRGIAGTEALRWQLWVAVPRAQALSPVRALGWVFALLLALVALATLPLAGVVSARIAQPVLALTAFARRHRSGQPLPPVPAVPQGEIGELQQAFVRMVADIERSQAQLARASALAAVGEMSAVIAHEVRTPLGIVLSSAQVLSREAALSATGRELVGYIESETARLGRLVSAMLESARPRAPRFERTELRALIGHAVGLLSAQADKQGVSVSAGAGEGALDCDVDPEQLTQVLLNLILNGLQVLPRGGRIEIGAQGDGEQVRIDIADDGPGIAPEARARLFEAFYFRREGGIGLGLAVVQTLVAAHGGDIEATDSALGGALFRIRLPRRHDPVSP